MKKRTLKSALYAAGLSVFLCAAQTQAKDYVVDYQSSKVSFSGTHAGNVFTGSFGEWKAVITFDPADLEASKLTAVFNPASAKTGNSMYDGTLPQADWFDVKNHAEAHFVSAGIAAGENGVYDVTGDLTIRGITKPVTFDFTLSDPEQAPVKAQGTLRINRLDFDIGKKSDAPAEWVSRDIAVTLDITANPAEEERP